MNEKKIAESRGRRDAGMVIENEISGQIVNAAIEVQKTLGGPGLLERIYEDALFQELILRGIKVERQLCVPVVYKNINLRDPLRLDLLVENKVIIEVKATANDHPLYTTQVLTYLRLTNLKLGLVINFGKGRIIDGLIRVVNGL